MNRFGFIYISIFFLSISIFSFLNIIYSYYFNLYLNIDAYIYSLILSLILGLALLFKKKNDIKISIYEKIIIVLIGYITIPILISVPYYLSIYNISFLDCYFESISGFTSTGFTIFSNIKHLDESLILWRSSSQWIGGIYFLFSIILLIDVFDDNLKKSLTNFLSFNINETIKQSFKIFILYSVLTLILFIILNIIDIRTFDSLNLSMTIISSGGFIPVNSIESILNTKFKEIIFSLLLLTSFFSLFLSYNLIFLKKKNLNFFTEDLYLVIYFFALIFVFFVFLNHESNFSTILLSLTSSISNVGISNSNISSNLYFVFLLLVIIGGSFFSTSSGIRFIKIHSLIKFSLNELLSHARPKHVFVNKLTFSSKNLNQSDISKYFLSVVIFIICLFLITLILTIFNNNFDESFKIGILTIMNTVNSSMYGLKDYSFNNLDIFSKSTLMLFMIIGRVELLTLIIISKKFLFKN
tara:strand:- start:3576 stop:4982 length:1407 start_codon:yes stop_codon:yes gene_type:complete